MNKLSLLVAAILATNISAEEVKKKDWQVASELGVIITSGNTETTTFKGGIAAKHKMDNWKNEYKFNALYKEDEITQDDGTKESERSNEKYALSAQGNYILKNKHAHLFVYGSYVSDYFGAFRNEAVVSLGYGKRFYDSSSMSFDAEVGPGYKYFEYAKGTKNADGILIGGDTDGEPIALGKLDFNWDITDYAKFSQLAIFEYGESNTKSQFETALLTKINGSMQMKVGFKITNNSDVAPEKEKTDTETVLTLVYNF